MFWNLASNKKEWVEEQLDGMTLDEKIGQLVSERAASIMKSNEPCRWIEKYPVGSVFVGSEIIDVEAEGGEKTKDNVSSLKKASRVPVLFCGDFEHGVGAQISGYTRLPDLMALGAAGDKELAYQYGRVIAEEGRSLGLHWAFGPVADLNTNHMNPVTNTRALTDNPDHCVKILSELVRGMQENGLAACPKHFPGDGTDTRNQHNVTSLNLLEKSEWDKFHGKVFKGLIDAGAASIMVGHLGFPAVEDFDGTVQKFRPATASRKIMTGLLREELGFKGIILTDALTMRGFTGWADYDRRILDSLEGGTDIFLWPDTERFFKLIKTCIEEGRVSPGRIDESVRRIMSFKAWLGLNDPNHEKPALMHKDKEVNLGISRKTAEGSITLLKNRLNVIPLRIPANSKLLVVYTPESKTASGPLECFKRELESRSYQVTMLPLSKFSEKEGIGGFECVFLLCNCKPKYVEYSIYNNYGLWYFFDHEDIKKLILISFGTPYFLHEAAGSETYINAYSDCEESQKAAVGALFGELPFRGKSPVVIGPYVGFGGGLRA